MKGRQKWIAALQYLVRRHLTPLICRGGGIRPGGRFSKRVDSCAIIKRICRAKSWYTIINTRVILLLFRRKRSMSDEISQPMQTELFAASLRADKNDLKTFLDALASKLEGSL